MVGFALLAARPQKPMPQAHYDLWRAPDSDEIALLFYRTPAGYLLRFPGIADFAIAAAGYAASCRPAPDAPEDLVHDVIDEVIAAAAAKDGAVVQAGRA